MQCYVCRASVTDEHRFCEQCGQPFPSTRPPEDVLARFDLDSFNQLRDEKERLRRSLEGIVIRAGEGGVSESDRGAWTELYERWTTVRDRITQALEPFHSRTDHDRRGGQDRRAAPRADDDRRAGVDRRDPFRVKNPYRRRRLGS